MDKSYNYPAPSPEEVAALVRTVSLPSIQKTVLQALCVILGVAKTGNKIDLQRRLAKEINDSKEKPNRYYEIQESIREKTGLSLPPLPPRQPPPAQQPQLPVQTPSYRTLEHRGAQYATGSAMAPSYSAPRTYLPTNGHQQAPSNLYTQQTSTPSPSSVTWPRSALTPLVQSQPFKFKPSPFYQILCRLGDLKTFQAMPQHRNSVNISLKAQDNQYLQHCAADTRYRVLVFCAGGNEGEQDIAFPHAAELKVNGVDIKANMRGLKNKPGSTRPVDITPSLRLKPPSYINTVEFTYAMTQKVQQQPQPGTYYLGVYVCRTTPVEELVAGIKTKIVKNQVIADFAKKANDPDVEATSINLSLKCPLSYMRLKTPCRSISCTHVSCFDATSYLQLQEQGPQWLCPICSKSAPYEQLAIDEYVTEIIKGTPDSVEQVTIEPNGKWVQPGAARKNSESASVLDDDDLYISDLYQTPNANSSTPRGPGGSLGGQRYLGTPSNSGSRGSSTVPKSSAGTKRPAAEVIDLTLSSDDEEQQRPPKRVNYGAAAYENYH